MLTVIVDASSGFLRYTSVLEALEKMRRLRQRQVPKVRTIYKTCLWIKDETQIWATSSNMKQHDFEFHLGSDALSISGCSSTFLAHLWNLHLHRLLLPLEYSGEALRLRDGSWPLSLMTLILWNYYVWLYNQWNACNILVCRFLHCYVLLHYTLQ